VVSERILAYITAFCDQASLERCIGSIRHQTITVDQILVIDNSPHSLLKDHGLKEFMTVLHCPENIGVGGGVEVAVRVAIHGSYDLLWLLDQDSQPEMVCLENLVTAFRKYCRQYDVQVGIVAPRIVDECMGRELGCAKFIRYRFKENQLDWQGKLWVECDAPIISGSLVSVAAAKIVGFPRSDLFIDGVDLDYGLRFRKAGFYNFIISNAILYHHLGTPLAIEYGNQKRFIHNYSVDRTYYYYRNHTYLEVEYAKSYYFVMVVAYRFKLMVKDIALTILYRDRKLNRIYACCLGTLHGFQGKLGKLKKTL
jgi:rhamnosyltransferase